MNLVIILTKTPSNQTVTSLLRIFKHDCEAELYVCGDGVYSVLVKSETAGVIRKLLDKKSCAYVCEEDMKARGITGDMLIKGVKIDGAFYDSLVQCIMRDKKIPFAI